jgi:hypothetical protein
MHDTKTIVVAGATGNPGGRIGNALIKAALFRLIFQLTIQDGRNTKIAL